MSGGIISRIFLAAILGGAIAGAVLAIGHQFFVVPMILQAETYETAGGDEGASHAHEDGEASVAHDHGEEAWGPEDGAERTAYTFLSSIITAVGFGLLLTACYALRKQVSWRQGILWGLAGFATFHFAPALGLPPELPGAAAAELGARQFWWIATVVLTAGGLAVLAFAPGYFRFLGLVPLVLPHIVGAPQPEHHEGLAPAELEQAFVYVSLLANGVFWIVLGATTAYFFDRFGTGTEPQGVNAAA